jgi:hypothetical protein
MFVCLFVICLELVQPTIDIGSPPEVTRPSSIIFTVVENSELLNFAVHVGGGLVYKFVLGMIQNDLP